MAITPNTEQFAEYAKSDLDGEVVMLNLLRFARTGASEKESGAAAYGRYGDQVTKMIEAQGGTIVWSGLLQHCRDGYHHDGTSPGLALAQFLRTGHMGATAALP